MSMRSFERRAGWKPVLREPCLLLMLIGATLVLNACGSMPNREPIQVSVAGLESLPGEGLEVRTLLKLRVQNPNEAPIDYDGVSVTLDLQGKTYASGVSDVQGTIPRFGEAVIDVPVTVSTLRVALGAIGHMRDGKPPEKLKYKLKGRLGGSLFGPMSFEADGELDLAAPGTQVH